MLIATRALLGVAGATLAPSTLSLIRNMFHDPRERAVAISVWITATRPARRSGRCSAGCCWSILVGLGVLPAVPVMGLLLVVGPTLLPECRDPAGGSTCQRGGLARRRAGGDLGLKRAAQEGAWIDRGAGNRRGARFWAQRSCADSTRSPIR